MALVLAAGESRRFWPLSSSQHKSLFEVGGLSLLERTVNSLVAAGVTDVVIVESRRSQYADPQEAVLPSDRLPADYPGCRIRFVEQPTAEGQGDAILRSAHLLGEAFFVVQPENINAGEIVAELTADPDPDDLVVVAGQERADFSLYAVLEHEGGRLRSIVEKPPSASSPRPLVNMGVYLCRRGFVDLLAGVEPGQLSMITAIGQAADRGQARVVRSSHPFLPLKFPGHLWAYARLLGLADRVGARGRVLADHSCVLGDGLLDNVILSPGVVVGAGTRTSMPAGSDDLDAVVIGRRATLGADVVLDAGVRIGAYATIGNGVHVTSDVPERASVSRDKS